MKTEPASENMTAPRWYRVTFNLILFVYVLILAFLPPGAYPFHHFYTATCGMDSGGWEEFLSIGTFVLFIALVVAAVFWLVRRFACKKGQTPARPVERPVRSLGVSLLWLGLGVLGLLCFLPPNSSRYSRAVMDNWTFSARLYRLLSADEIDDARVFSQLMRNSNGTNLKGAYLLLEHGVPAAMNPRSCHVLLPDGRRTDIPVADATAICDTLGYAHCSTPCLDDRLHVLELLLKRGDDPNCRVYAYTGDSLSLPLDIILGNLCAISSSFPEADNLDFCLRATDMLLAHGADYTAWSPRNTANGTVGAGHNTPAARLAQSACYIELVGRFLDKLLLRHPELKETILSTLGAEDRADLEGALRQTGNDTP